MTGSSEPLPLDDLIAGIDRSEAAPLDRLREALDVAGRLSSTADLLVDHFVQFARAAGHTWAEVGAVLGVSKQAAQQRYVSGRPGAKAIASVLSGMHAAAARHFTAFGDVLGIPGLERFADDARRAVIVARDLAKELGHSVVGTEHLLVGVLADDAWPSTRAFEGSGLTGRAIRRKVERSRPRGKTSIPEGTHVPFSAGAKMILALAMREALQMGMNRIGPGHILLALIRHGEGTAVGVLDEMGIDLAELRSDVVRAVQMEASVEGTVGDEPPAKDDVAGGGEPR